MSAKIVEMDALQIVAEPHRREILRLVWDADRASGDIAEHFDITMGAVSQHLGVLREAGYVTVTKDGNRRLYRADHKALGDLRVVLESIWASSLDSLVETIESDHAASSDE
jgi:DNA-binding transcriptional ArsR family regulator